TLGVSSREEPAPRCRVDIHRRIDRPTVGARDLAVAAECQAAGGAGAVAAPCTIGKARPPAAALTPGASLSVGVGYRGVALPQLWLFPGPWCRWWPGGQDLGRFDGGAPVS